MNITHQISSGLKALGYNSGWAVSGDEIVLWEHDAPIPPLAEILEAAKQAAATAAATVASGRNKLAALGLTDDEINALLGNA